MTLVEFLRARLDEDEQRAKKDAWIADHGSAGAWEAWVGHNLPYSDLKAEDQPIARFNGPAHDGDVMLAARFKPAEVRDRAERMLAEVDAKRRIVELHEPIDGHCSSCLESENDFYGKTYEDAPCITLRLLALPYADHPDYDPAWRP